MVRNCAVIGCNASSRMANRKFFRFPMIQKRNANILDLTQRRQEAWARALNRANFFQCHYKNATVCDRHFISGRSAKYDEVENVDWVPTLHLGYTIKTGCDQQNECYERLHAEENVNYVPPLNYFGHQINKESEQQKESYERLHAVENVNWPPPLKYFGHQIKEECDQQEDPQDHEVEKLDWIPPLNYFGHQIKKEFEQQEECYEKYANSEPTLNFKLQIKKECDQEEDPLEQSDFNQQFEVASNEEPKSKVTQAEFIKFSVGTQTDDSYTGMSSDIITSYQERIAFLEEMLNIKNVKLNKS